MGYIHLYTGNGKGKTTAAVGLATRAVGRGQRVLFVQFMKPEGGYGEQTALRKLGVEVHAFGRNSFVKMHNPDEVDIRLARDGLEFAREALSSGEYDLIVLDEINVAAHCGLVSVEDVLDAVRSRAERTEVVLTGRYAPPAFIEMADLVTEMREVKHYFREGVMAREGVEF